MMTCIKWQNKVGMVGTGSKNKQITPLKHNHPDIYSRRCTIQYTVLAVDVGIVRSVCKLHADVVLTVMIPLYMFFNACFP